MSITHQLSLFVDVVQQGSFTKAAALHDMDNSSLSKQIKKLESTLGVQLLNRSTRSFSLTSAGEEILEQSHILTHSLNTIRNIADSYQSEPKGSIRVISAIFFGQEYLQPAITKFMRKYPKVKITLEVEDKKTDIISNQFDLAFRVGKLTDSNLIAKKIAKTNFAIIASKDFIKQHGQPKTPEELIALPAVVYSNGETTLDQIKLSETPHSNILTSYKMQGNYKVSDVRIMINAVKDGLGYSMIDLFNLDRPLVESNLVPLLTDHTLSTLDTGIYAVYPHKKQTMLVAEFIQTVQEHIGTPAYWESYIPGYNDLYK
ncbi:LysR family transcriptional regulator [Vibrio algarum]|uniref:LysR family transcriptional regulator n=1 Tax=Vibrio algarum TaxID=3020714 RepID=A0ABT4YYD9_9VIBR|nr:LysR family transcriptional regulator [Vibrio sp. KJ40-1]MDB1126044.1 LysR family transcriptional regulator [Vibrio sp. KJ40-1]